MNNLKRKMAPVVAIVVTVVLGMSIFAGCSSTATQTTAVSQESTANAETNTTQTSGLKFTNEALVLTGSTTLLEVAQKWTEEFMKLYGGKITVNGGGSGEGIAALINGTTDLATASRTIKDEEKAQVEEAGGKVKEYAVLNDGICVVTSKNIDVKELTTDQLADIFMGNITNWKEVGGPDANIVAAARDTSSGTGEYFLEEIIQKGKTEKENDYSPNCLRLQSNSDIVNQVAGNDNTIGYIGIGYLKEAGDTVNVVGIIKDGKPAVLPTLENVANKFYPISRELYIYADENNMTEIAKAFLDFVLSPEGQAIGEETGFVRIK